MMKRALFALALSVAAWPVRAQDLIDDRACGFLIHHEPAPDVEYRPGVDVDGRPVTEADITPSFAEMPRVFSFPMTVDLARATGLAAPEGLEGATVIGVVTYDEGRLFYNGHPLEGEAEAQLKALCVEKGKKG